MSFIKMAQMAKTLVESRRENDELKAKLAGLEKRAAAEDFLHQVMDEPGAPSRLKPTSIADFFEKRAVIEQLDDIKIAETAMKLAGAEGFEIGDPESLTPLYQSSESPADEAFINWLLDSQG